MVTGPGFSEDVAVTLETVGTRYRRDSRLAYPEATHVGDGAPAFGRIVEVGSSRAWGSVL